MSAIIITQASAPGERTRLLGYGAASASATASNPTKSNGRSYRPYTSSSSSSIGPSSPSSPSPAYASGIATPSSTEILLRSRPLKDSISLPRFVLVCAGIWSANFVFAFQSTAIPTLAPGISSGFEHAELSSYLGSVFALANTAVIPLYGLFMEALGRKFAMDTACLFFGLGTVACALSDNIYMLIAARGLAGLGGGGLLTVSSVIVTDLVPLRDRGLYQGIMMTIFGAGSMAGGPVAGLLADTYGWQVSFWVQIPVVLFCALIVTLFVPEAPIPPTHRTLGSGLRSLDWLGTVLLIGSTTTLILGLSFHTSYLEPWSAPIVWGNLLAALLASIALVWVEGKVKRPLIPLELFADRHTAAIMASGFFLSVVAQAFMYQIPVYFTVIVNSSTAEAGLILSVCGGLGLGIGSLIAGHHIRKGGKYKLLGIISLSPAIVCGFLAAAWNPTWKWWQYYASFFPSPLGYSVFLCVNLIALISAVDSKIMPKATALLYTTRTLGGTLGVSIGGSIQLGALASALKTRFATLPNRDDVINSILHSKAAIRLLPPDLQRLALDAYARSLSIVWICCGSVAVLTVISACLIDEIDIHGNKEVEGTGGGAVEGGYGEGLGEATVEGETGM